MKGNELLQGLVVKKAHGLDSVEVTHVTSDSRKVRPGSLYFAMEGEKFDGHQFIAQALSKGAVAIIGSKAEALTEASAWALVESPRDALAAVAYRLAGAPGRRMRIVGITGTNGKTTNTYIAETCARAAGMNPGVIGTINARWNDQEVSLGHTTPEAPDLADLLSRMAEDGVDVVFLEVSSHGIALKRVEGLDFTVGVFTNLSQDHLDFHGTMEAYGETKAGWLREAVCGTETSRGVVVNVDDEFGARMAPGLRGTVLGVGIDGASTVKARDLVMDLSGSSFVAEGPWGTVWVRSAMVGRHNVMNVLTTLSTMWLLGADVAICARAIEGMRGVPGRLESIRNPFGVGIWVDYAHTPDALDKVGETLKAVVPGRIITVFGAGGDRDPGKRPRMAAAVERFSAVAVVTSDNPRSEKPWKIIEGILGGLSEDYLFHQTLVIPDRRLAIEAAVSMARQGDGVLLAGKGHEGYWLVGTQVLEFDDRKVASEAVEHRTGSGR